MILGIHHSPPLHDLLSCLSITPFTMLLLHLLATISLLLPSTHAFNRSECQYPTLPDPLQGCPPGTLLVGANSTFQTIQSAILSLPNDTTSHHILIQPGTYTEQVNITRPGPLTILGVSTSPNTHSLNTVNLIWHDATAGNTNKTYDNAFTSTLTIAPTLDSSLTGSGPTGHSFSPLLSPPGSLDFRAYNINITNAYLPYAAGPSLALSISYSNASFYFCEIASYQDTVYIGKLGNTYIYGGSVAGETDFLYGFGTLWIQDSALLLRGCGGGIVAWKGTNTTAPFSNSSSPSSSSSSSLQDSSQASSNRHNAYGAYITNTTVSPANSSLAASLAHKCALGRPWNSLHRSIYSRCSLASAVRDSGYVAWDGSALAPNASSSSGSADPRITADTVMGEYMDYGDGFNVTGRELAEMSLGIEILLAKEEWEARYERPGQVFWFPLVREGQAVRKDNVAWIDSKPFV